MVKTMKRAERSESRTVSKKCPDCDQQCPVALRACSCGYSFTKTRPNRNQTKQKNVATTPAATGTKTSKASTSSTPEKADTDSNLDKVGRRFRTKRMRPDYFNSLELEYASRTFRQRKAKTEEKELKVKKKRGRPKGTTGIPRRSKEEKRREEEEAKQLPELDDMYANFSSEKLQQFSFILDELNLKMSSQIFKPL